MRWQLLLQQQSFHSGLVVVLMVVMAAQATPGIAADSSNPLSTSAQQAQQPTAQKLEPTLQQKLQPELQQKLQQKLQPELQPKLQPKSLQQTIEQMQTQINQLLTQVKTLQQENAEIKRGHREFAVKIRDELDHSVMAQELAQDIDSQFHQSLKISGYADVEANFNEQSNYFRLHHFSLFFNKPIADKWHLFSEVEYEDAPLFEAENEQQTVTTPTGSTRVTKFEHASGAIFLEAMNLDYRWKPRLSSRLGRFFTPAGIWSIDHYPPFVTTQERPLHIRHLFPQLIDGIDIYGKFNFGEHGFGYDVYVGNGENNDTISGDRDGNKSIGVRASVDLDWLKRVEFGISLYRDSNLTNPCSGANAYKIARGAHYNVQWRNWALQSEYALADYEKAAASPQCQPKGAYTQVSWKWRQTIVGARVDQFDDKTQAEKRRQSLFFNYRLEKDILLKLESHRQSQERTVSRWTIATVAVNLGH